jgi:hypothetical protein
MKPLLFAVGVAVCLGFQADLKAQESLQPDRAAGEAAVQEEVDLIAAAHNAAQQDNDSIVDTKLAAAPHTLLKSVDGILLARRTAAVCAWLRNDLEFERAKKLARKAVRQLERIAVTGSDADRVERLYWEAWLWAEGLDEKKNALRLLAEAEKLIPDDPRLAWGKRNWTTGG